MQGSGCEKHPSSPYLKVGVTAGPHAIIMQYLAEKHPDAGIKVIEFDDFILPNTALDAGELDINSYQHQPFLDEQNQTRGYHLVSVGKTVLMPIGVYSMKHASMNRLPYGAKIVIPQDPSNGGRALLFFQKLGLLTLRSTQGLPTCRDIITNPKNMVFLEADAPALPRLLPDVDAAVINTDWVMLAKMDPNQALAKEDKNSPYANVLVVRQGQEGKAKKLLEYYHSEDTRKFIEQRFGGSILPVW